MRLDTLALLLTVLAGRLPAQEIIFEDGEIVFIGDVVEGLAQAVGEGTEEAEEDAEPTERQKKLQKLEYDRRPSKIFEAWSKPAPEAPEAPPPFEEEPPAEPQVAASVEEETSEDTESTEKEPQETVQGEEAGTEISDAGDEESPPEVDPAVAAAREAFEAAKADWEERKQEAEAAQKKYETEVLEWELEVLQRNVSIGDWAAVATYFESLSEEEGKAGFERLIESLAKGPPKKEQVPPQGQRHREKNQFSPGDVVGLMGVAPIEASREILVTLGKILNQALEAGHQLETFLLEIDSSLDQEESAVSRRQVALLVAGAGREAALEKLLPTSEEAEEADDREGLNLLSRYYLASHAEDGKTEWLEQAWRTTQAVLAVGEVDEEQKKEAIQRAVAIAPKIRDELGQAWLDESFTERPERGMEILAAVGAEASKALSMIPTDQEARFRLLELQTTTANTLLEAAPELAGDWNVQLELLGANWLREALVSYELDDSTSMGPSMQRDVFGNFFYYDYRSRSRGNAPEPIRTWQLLEIRPGDAWIGQMEGTLRPQFQMLYAKLMLKVGEEAPAFPYIEQLAVSLPEQAEDLVGEFLRVWTRNHDPNSESRRSSRYIYFYGFEQRAEGIPLTRSKQERNLAELAEWVARLRELPVEVDDELVATAFKTAHSSAEIYRLETIERIFGSMAALEPATLAGLVQTMRTNLTQVWRDPAVQKEKGTNRRQKDIQAEVDRGYQLASATLDRALEDHPESWELWLAKASIQHDHNNYRHELAKDTEFSQRRQASFEIFAQAAGLYASALPDKEQDEESVQVYDTWFYAALGACDLDAVRPELQLAQDQVAHIQEALNSLPEDRAERHVDKFASSFFSRMSSVNPAVKFRYLREGLRITGDNKLAREARSVFEYYNDLVTEIQLIARVDGSDRVGHAQPFGLQVDLRHTREIERESGGFSKYLQNQQNQRFGYNYGRPLENYREKFEESVRERLNEHFDVISITFNDPETRSRADEEYGWRVTPYAYVLLQPRGPEVDRVPALSLDLDFLDTSGYAVLPIESPALPLDAMDAAGDARPYEGLAVTQTLDERQVDRGKLIVEAKATAQGLLPDFDALFELQPEGFEISAVEDQGVSVVQFHEEGQGVLSERSWTVTMQAAEGLEQLPSQFSFATPRVEAESVEQYRYDDADLVAVESTVDLIESWGEKDRGGLWRVALGLLVLGAAGVFGWRWMNRPQVMVESRFQMPERLTPFTVIGLLRDISSGNGLATADHAQLERDIENLEQHYFVEERAGGVDLRRIAESWLERAS